MAKPARLTASDSLHPIVEEIGVRLTQRLEDIKKPFEHVLDITGDFGGVSHLLTDVSDIKTCHAAQQPEASFDLIVSNLSFSLSDDLQQTLLKSGKSLKRDGLLLVSVLGGESFSELKESFYHAGSRNGHVSLFPDVQSCGMLLQGLQFSMPVVDRELITLHYSNFKDMWADIRSLGKYNQHPEKWHGLMSPALWQKMEEYYWQNFATEQGEIPLTLEVIYLTGWRADKSHQKPLPVGAKAIPLTDVLK
jgi:SAM-dependent methyltransferase